MEKNITPEIINSDIVNKIASNIDKKMARYRGHREVLFAWANVIGDIDFILKDARDNDRWTPEIEEINKTVRNG